MRKTERDSKKNTFQLKIFKKRLRFRVEDYHVVYKSIGLVTGNNLELRFVLTLSYSADKHPLLRVFG